MYNSGGKLSQTRIRRRTTTTCRFYIVEALAHDLISILHSPTHLSRDRTCTSPGLFCTAMCPEILHEHWTTLKLTIEQINDGTHNSHRICVHIDVSPTWGLRSRLQQYIKKLWPGISLSPAWHKFAPSRWQKADSLSCPARGRRQVLRCCWSSPSPSSPWRRTTQHCLRGFNEEQSLPRNVEDKISNHRFSS